MNHHVCPRCGNKFPEWQPVHFICLVGRLQYWIWGMTAIVAVPILFFGYQVASTTAFTLSERQGKQETLSPSVSPDEQVVGIVVAATRQKSATPTSTTPRELPSTFTPSLKPTATQIPKPTPTTPLVIKATPKAVSEKKEPLAIDFLIDGIEIDADTVEFHITVFRRANTSLPWETDEGRRDKIYLQGNSNRYRLINMGGLFVQNTTLEPQTSYKGWFIFAKPTEGNVIFHYPDIEEVEVNLTQFGLKGQSYVDGSQPTFTPHPPLASTPTPRRQTSTPTAISISKPICNQSVTGQFRNLWDKYRQELGCPLQSKELGADTVYFVEQPFQNGHMFFFSSGPVNFVIVKYGTTGEGQPGSGNWQSFSSEAWSGKDENFCDAGNGLDPPIYDNFNKVWCFESGVRDRIGYPKDIDSRLRAKLYGADNSQHVLAQGFDNGFILRDSDGVNNHLVYVFFNNETYVRDYY